MPSEVEGQSQNFAFLLPAYPFLEAIAAWAEQYAHHDPAGSLNKTRQLGEGLLREANARHYRMVGLETASFADLIHHVSRRPGFPRALQQKLQVVKQLGNLASHYDAGQARLRAEQAIDALRECHGVAQFFGDLALGLKVPRAQFKAPKKAAPPRILERELEALRQAFDALQKERAAAPPAPLPKSAQDAEATVEKLKLDDGRAKVILAGLTQVGLAKSYQVAKAALEPAALAAVEALERGALNDAAALGGERVPGADDQKLAWAAAGALRVVFLAPETSDLRLLLWVGPEANARAWATSRTFEVHPQTGALQEVVHVAPGGRSKARPLLGHVSQADLLTLGVPAALVKVVQAVAEESLLTNLLEALPEEASERLQRLLTGDSLEALLAAARDQGPARVATDDVELAMAHPDARRRFFLAASRRELEQALAQPLEAWRLFLHPSQAGLVGKAYKGPARVLGGAGTGKTVVAMHRAKALAERGEGKVLFTSFSRNLADNLRRQVESLCGPAAKRIQVDSLDSVAVALAGRAQGGRRLEIASADDLRGAWDRAIETAGSAGRSRGFLEAELAWTHEQVGVTTKDAYLTAKRKGRGRMTRPQLLEVWTVLEALRAALGGKLLWSDVHRLARAQCAREGPPYRAVVVDEAQDMSGEQLRLLRALVAEGPDDLFFVGDAHQRIWRDAIPFSSCGVSIVGRSTKLALNYRTTEAIRRFAVRAVEPLKVDDLDQGDDSKEGCVSLRAGVAPALRGFPSEADETAFVVAEVRRLIDGGAAPESICLLAREGRRLGALAAALERAKIPSRRLDAKDASDDGAGVRLSTMHRSKGLEFMHVLAAGMGRDELPPKASLEGADDDQRALVDRQERALLYVACSRARESLTVTWAGAPSPLLGQVGA